MRIKKSLAAAAVSLALSAITSQVSAVPILPANSPVEFKFADFTTGKSTFGSPCALGAGCENTFTLGSVTSITDGFNNIYSQGDNGEFLTFMTYGISDFSIIPNGPNLDIYSVGATAAGAGDPKADGFIHIDVYIDGAAAPNANTTGPNDRSGYDSYPGITDGALYLSLILVPGIALDDPSTPAIDESLATLFTNASAATSTSTGDGSFLAEVTGGIAAAQFDTNGQAFGADFFGQFDFSPNPAAVCQTSLANPLGSANPECFDNVSNDPVRGRTAAQQVPEPATLALLGAGLFGLASMKRRRPFTKQ